MTVDRSLKKLYVSTEALTMQISLVKSPLALVSFVLSSIEKVQVGMA